MDWKQRLTLIWAEPSEHDDLARPFAWTRLRLQSLWSSRYDAKSWTTPKQLYSGRTLWGRPNTDDFVRASDGSWHVVAPTLMAESSPLMHARLDGDQWAMSSIPTHSDAIYSSVATLIGENALIVAFIGALKSARGPDVNSVFIIRSADLGASWSEEEVISRSGSNPAYEVRVRSGQDGALHLVWIQEVQNGHRVLRHKHSLDGGRVWSESNDVAPREGFMNGLQAVVDRCGTLHVVYQTTSDRGKTSALFHATWNKAWVDHERLFDGVDGFDPALQMLATGELVLSFLGRVENVGDSVRESYISFLRP